VKKKVTKTATSQLAARPAQARTGKIAQQSADGIWVFSKDRPHTKQKHERERLSLLGNVNQILADLRFQLARVIGQFRSCVR